MRAIPDLYQIMRWAELRDQLRADLAKLPKDSKQRKPLYEKLFDLNAKLAMYPPPRIR